MLHGGYTDISALDGLPEGELRVRGFVRSNRRGGQIGFIDLNDGTRHAGVQVIYDISRAPALEAAAKYPTGAAISVRGRLVRTPEAKQPYEVRAEEITLVGPCDGD
ncbi:MAG: hypothetical protein LBC78_00425, partial [Oscillospiraceae bacterium]|nr:hypothetical protein [Oscillospiraceae bacterium]